MKEKEIIEEELRKEKSMYITSEIHQKHVKYYEPEIQISLDSGIHEEMQVDQSLDFREKSKKLEEELKRLA